MKLRLVFFSLIFIVLLLLSTAGAGLYWILQQSPLFLSQNNTSASSAAAIFVPRQAALMVSLLANPDRLELVQELKTPLGKRGRIQQEINQVKNNLLANTGLDYRQDIQPWLGSQVTFAITSLDFDRDPENGVRPGYLLALKAQDGELAKEFLQLSFSKQAIAGTADLVFDTYKGIDLISKRPLDSDSETNTFASAVVGDFVLLANHPQVLRNAINNVQVPDLNLESAPFYQEALKTIEEPEIGLGFFNLPVTSAWIGSQQTPEAPEAEQMLVVGLSLKPEGIVAETALIGVGEQGDRPPTLSQPIGALQYIPSSSILTIAGTDLNQFWQQIQAGLDPATPVAQLINRSLISLQKSFPLDLPQDIFSWVTGEYALSLLPDGDNQGIDWIFVAEEKEQEKAEAAIAYLDTIATEQKLNQSNFLLGENEVTAWTEIPNASGPKEISLEQEIKGVHLQLDKYQILGTSIDALSATLEGDNNSILDRETFGNAIATLPTENDGYFYLDWKQGRSILEGKFSILRLIEFTLQPLINYLDKFTIASQGTENGIRHGTVFLNLD